MACECIATMDKHLAAHNSRLTPSIVFARRGVLASELRAHITTEKINTRSRESMGAIATFCPFCGVAYVEEPAQVPDPEPSLHAQSQDDKGLLA